jgi:hypothetical protein
MNLFRWDTNSLVDWLPHIEFYFIRNRNVWHWNNYDKRWDEAWHGVAYWTPGVKKGWHESSPLEFVLLTGKAFDPTELDEEHARRVAQRATRRRERKEVIY